MPRNGSGTYAPPVNSWNPAVNTTPATAADFQALLNDMAASITQSISKDGQTPITSPITFDDVTVVDFTYSGTLTGSTGILNIGSNQIYKDASGNVGIGVVPVSRFQVNGVSAFAAGTALSPGITTTGDLNTGFYFPAADTVSITTAGVDRLRVSSTGDAGLGVTPSDWGGSNRAMQLKSPASGGALGAIGALGITDEVVITRNAYNNTTNWIYNLTGSFATLYQQSSAGQHVWYNAPTGTAGNPITFTQAMTLTQGGNLLLGTTAEGASSPVTTRIAVQDALNAAIFRSNSAVGGYPVRVWNADTVGDNLFVQFLTEGSITSRGFIDYNRAGGLTRYNTTSDGTLKNIKNPAKLDDSVALIMSIPIDEWAWKDDPEQWSQVGPIAQKLHACFPGAVSVGGNYEAVVPATYDEEGNELTPETTETLYRPWAVDKTAPVWHLVATCQKQQQIIESQQAQIESILARLDALESN